MENKVTSYFEENGETASTLAAKIGSHPSTITRALRGERQPSFELARKIEAATEGRLTAKDFISACMDANPGAAAQPEQAA